MRNSTPPPKDTSTFVTQGELERAVGTAVQSDEEEEEEVDVDQEGEQLLDEIDELEEETAEKDTQISSSDPVRGTAAITGQKRPREEKGEEKLPPAKLPKGAERPAQETSARLTIDQQVEVKRAELRYEHESDLTYYDGLVTDFIKRACSEGRNMAQEMESQTFKELRAEQKQLEDKINAELAEYRKKLEEEKAERSRWCYSAIERNRSGSSTRHRHAWKHRFEAVEPCSLGPYSSKLNQENSGGIAKLYASFYEKMKTAEKSLPFNIFACAYCTRSLHQPRQVTTDTIAEPWVLCRRCFGTAYCSAAHRHAHHYVHEMSCAIHPGWQPPSEDGTDVMPVYVAKSVVEPRPRSVAANIEMEKWVAEDLKKLRRDREDFMKSSHLLDPGSVTHAAECMCFGCQVSRREGRTPSRVMNQFQLDTIRDSLNPIVDRVLDRLDVPGIVRNIVYHKEKLDIRREAKRREEAKAQPESQPQQEAKAQRQARPQEEAPPTSGDLPVEEELSREQVASLVQALEGKREVIMAPPPTRKSKSKKKRQPLSLTALRRESRLRNRRAAAREPEEEQYDPLRPEISATAAVAQLPVASAPEASEEAEPASPEAKEELKSGQAEGKLSAATVVAAEVIEVAEAAEAAEEKEPAEVDDGNDDDDNEETIVTAE